MLDNDELNTTLLVVLILLVIFLVIIYFTVNYNQSQKANIINEKANVITEKVSSLKMDCPKCPDLECPLEKECPDCNCPVQPPCPKCPPIPKPEKCPELKCPQLKCPQLNISKDGSESVQCPECPSLSCPDINIPDRPTVAPVPVRPQNQPRQVMSGIPVKAYATPELPRPIPVRPTALPKQPHVPIVTQPTYQPMPYQNTLSNAMTVQPAEVRPHELLPRGMIHQPKKKSPGFLPYPQPETIQKGSPYINQVISQMATGQIGNNKLGDSISSGGFYPIQSITGKCPISGSGPKESPLLSGSNVPSTPSITPNLIQPSNSRPAVVGPDETTTEPPVEEIPVEEPPVEEVIIEGFNTGRSW